MIKNQWNASKKRISCILRIMKTWTETWSSLRETRNFARNLWKDEVHVTLFSIGLQLYYLGSLRHPVKTSTLSIFINGIFNIDIVRVQLCETKFMKYYRPLNLFLHYNSVKIDILETFPTRPDHYRQIRCKNSPLSFPHTSYIQFLFFLNFSFSNPSVIRDRVDH